MPASLCDLAIRLPILIGALLDREAKLKRGRFREETMTDILTGSLAAFAGPNLVIEYPIEADTGGDLDLQFWHVKSGRSLLLRLQAKRLNAEAHATGKVKIQNRAYRELLHKPPSASELQYETLCKAPRPWLPLYMFYNHQSVVDDVFFTTPGPVVSGINLAFAHDIASEMDAKISAAKGKPKSVLHHKRLSHLRKHLFGLNAILCPGGMAGEPVPSPNLVAASLERCWNEAATRSGRDPGAGELVRRALEWPTDRVTGRSSGQLVSGGPAFRVSPNLERPTLTFISGRTSDKRTPVITDRHPD